MLLGSGAPVLMQVIRMYADQDFTAGSLVFNRALFDYWPGRNLKREVFPSLAREELLSTYRHSGFFKSMDSYKDQVEIDQLAQGGGVPWKL